MPYKKRKVYKRRKRKVAVRRPLPLGGFPARMMAKLKYVQTITLDAGAGTYAQNIFRANSLFDPDSTGVGHQPSNYDRLTAIYDRYTVLGAKAEIYFVPTSSTDLPIPPTIVALLSEGGTDISVAHASGGIDNVLEQPRIRRSVLPVGQNATNKILTLNFSAKKFFGVKNLIGESPYSADVAASPTEVAFFEVASVSPDDTQNPTNCTLRVELTYIAVFTEPKLTDAS